MRNYIKNSKSEKETPLLKYGAKLLAAATSAYVLLLINTQDINCIFEGIKGLEKIVY